MLNHTSQYAELTPRQFEAIGRLVVEWSNLEFLLASVLTRLLRTPDMLGRVYTDELMAVRLQSAIEKAIAIQRHRYGARLVPVAVLDELSSLNSKIQAVRGTRNRLSHFCWSRQRDDKLFGTAFSGHVPPSKQIDKDSIVLSMAQLDEMYKESYGLVTRLTELLTQLPEVKE